MNIKHSRILFVILWAALVVAGFQYYLKWTPFNRDSKRVKVVGDTTKTEDSSAASHTSHEEVGSKNTPHPTPNEKVVSHRTTQSGLDVEAENDSKKRRDSVNKVCQRLNVKNVLEPQATSSDKRVQQRSVAFKQFYVHEEHKVIYCGISKVSTTTIRQLLMRMNGFDRRTGKQGSNIEKRLLDFTEVEQNHMLNSFYKFMIVRDPFERLVSAYRDRFYNAHNDYANIAKKIIEKYRYNNSKTVELGAEELSFTEFVRFLIDIPSDNRDDHFRPFKDACSPCSVKYDFIGSTDNLKRDVTHIMRQIHADETKYYVTQKSGHLSNTKAATVRLFKEVPKKYFDQLLAIRKINFELYGYPLPDQKTLEKHYHA